MNCNQIVLTLVSFTTGKIQWDLYRSVLGDSPTPIATRLIWAENVQRYCYLETRTRADRIYINARLERCQPITHDTIIIQRTTAVEQPRRIIAHLFSPDSFGYPIQAENNTSYLVEIEDMHLKFVLGILNSKFIDFIFRHVNSNTHVSAGELNALPRMKCSQIQKILFRTLSSTSSIKFSMPNAPIQTPMSPNLKKRLTR